MPLMTSRACRASMPASLIASKFPLRPVAYLLLVSGRGNGVDQCDDATLVVVDVKVGSGHHGNIVAPCAEDLRKNPDQVSRLLRGIGHHDVVFK